jgi:hypothetical protein
MLASATEVIISQRRVIAAVHAEKATLLDHHAVCQLHLRNVSRMDAGLSEPTVFVFYLNFWHWNLAFEF